MEEIRALRLMAGLTQAQLAARAETSQSAIAAYESGAKSPRIRTIERIARSVGLQPVMVFVEPLTREDERTLALHAAVARKLLQDPEAVRRLARRNIERMSAANPGAGPLLQEWRRALDRPASVLLDLLTDPREHARDLRQVSPFAGVLSPKERQAILRRPNGADR